MKAMVNPSEQIRNRIQALLQGHILTEELVRDQYDSIIQDLLILKKTKSGLVQSAIHNYFDFNIECSADEQLTTKYEPQNFNHTSS